MRIRIITDDLTSALDGTACFAGAGWAVAVFVRPDDLASDDAVASFDTDTRANPAGSKAVSIAQAALAWRDADIMVLQFDSSLRGQVVRDCLTVHAVSGRRKLLIAPAFPAAGCTTVEGQVLVDGVPVNETSLGRDPAYPVPVASVATLFGAHGTRVNVARDATEARTLLDRCDAVVVDAQSDDGLDAIVRTFAARRDLLWAGSTGLLRAFARTLPAPPSAWARRTPRVSTRLWLVVGSVNPGERRQRDVAAIRRFVDGQVSDGSRLPLDYAASQAVLRDMVVRTVTAVRRGACDGLIVTGGGTARQIMDLLPARALRVLWEIMPGVSLAEIEYDGGTLPMIMKASGFGDDNTLVACIDVMRGTR
jgi:D-threonate/D-erythronate kinase